MKVQSDVEQINFSTGERWVRVVGDGENRLELAPRYGEKCACCGYNRRTHAIVKQFGGRDEWFGLCASFIEEAP